MIGLTERQRQVLAWIEAFTVEHGYAPTMREIGAAMSLRSTNAVNDHLRALERKGFISRASLKTRTIRVLRSAS